MKLRQITELLEAKVLCGEERLDDNNDYCFSSDLMSDVLTLGDQNPIIITGLCTMQTIRTCEMGNLEVVVFVRKKKPTPEMIELAEENGMILLSSDFSMFKACGILYQNGLKPLF